MEEDSDDRYSRMNEKITTVEKRMTMLEDPNNRGSEMKANDMEGTKAQEEQYRRRAVVTGFHDHTTEQEVQAIFERNHNYGRNVNGSITDAEERFHQKRFGYLKCCIHTKTQCTTRTDQNEQMDKTCIVNGEIVI